MLFVRVAFSTGGRSGVESDCAGETSAAVDVPFAEDMVKGCRQVSKVCQNNDTQQWLAELEASI